MAPNTKPRPRTNVPIMRDGIDINPLNRDTIRGGVAPPGPPKGVPKPPPAAGAKPPPGATAAQQTSARAIITDVLARYGLGDLGTWAWNTYINAGDDALGIARFNAQLPEQQAYKLRFPAISERVAKGLPAINEGQYIDYESKIRQAFTAYGLPLPTTGAGFNTIIKDLLVNDVSPEEVVNQRIGSAFNRVATAPVEVRQAFQKLWGVQGDAAMAAYFLDQTHSAPELERLSKAADVAGTATRFGIDINRDRALRLADVGADSNLGQFDQLSQMRPLFQANEGEDPNLTLEDQGVAAAFGENGTARTAVSRRIAERKAALGGGGGVYESGSGAGGLAGLGSGPT